MMAMQAEALSALPDPAWYFPSEAWEFAAWLEGREAFGYFDGEVMAGYAAIAPWGARAARMPMRAFLARSLKTPMIFMMCWCAPPIADAAFTPCF